jgi:hypothetical protein
MEVLFYPIFPDFRKSIAFWKAPRRRPFILLAKKHVDEDEYGAVME